MDIDILKSTINADLEIGKQPFLVIGNAGDVSTGVVDNLAEISTICKEFDLWFHVDGAYGVPAAVVPEYKDLFKGLEDADSIALDPHKWLYAPLEAGCTLVKNPQHLIDTYSSNPVYYNFGNTEDSETRNFFEFGLQNSRGFRALKVWMALQHIGKEGYVKLIGEDIALSKMMYDLAHKHNELEAVSHNLSLTTLRYVPVDYSGNEADRESYLNKLNAQVVNELQKGGDVFVSNSVVQEKYCLRACIVNFRTSEKDIQETIEIIVKTGRRVHEKLQAK